MFVLNKSARKNGLHYISISNIEWPTYEPRHAGALLRSDSIRQFFARSGIPAHLAIRGQSSRPAIGKGTRCPIDRPYKAAFHGDSGRPAVFRGVRSAAGPVRESENGNHRAA